MGLASSAFAASLSRNPAALASRQHVHLVTDKQGNGNENDGGQHHPVIMGKLLNLLELPEAEEDGHKEIRVHGRERWAGSIPIGPVLRFACTFFRVF